MDDLDALTHQVQDYTGENWLLFYTGRFILGQQPCTELAVQKTTRRTTIIHTTNTRCVLYIKAGAASMAAAWFTQLAGAAGAWFIRTVSPGGALPAAIGSVWYNLSNNKAL